MYTSKLHTCMYMYVYVYSDLICIHVHCRASFIYMYHIHCSRIFRGSKLLELEAFMKIFSMKIEGRSLQPVWKTSTWF